MKLELAMSYINIQSIFLFYSAFLALCVLALLALFWGKEDKSSLLWILSCSITGVVGFITVFRDTIPLVISYSAMVSLEVMSMFLLSQSIKALDPRSRWRNFYPFILISTVGLFIVLEVLRDRAEGALTPLMSLLVAIAFCMTNLYGAYVSRRVSKAYQHNLFFNCLSGLFLAIAFLQLWRVINSLTGYSLFAFDNKTLTVVAFFFIFLFGTLRNLTYIVMRMHLVYVEHDTMNSINLRLANVIRERNEMITSLEKLNKVTSTNSLASTLAHEVSQPLGASKLGADFMLHLLKNNPKDPKEIEEVAKSLVSNIDRISGIIRNLTNLSKVSKKEPVGIPLNKALDDILAICRSRLQAQKITIDVHLADSVLILINEAELGQVLINILNNAIDELESLNQPHKRIVIKGKRDGGRFVISIADNGRGVEASQRQDIFSLLVSHKPEGSGIGLWLSKEIIARYDGVIYCEESEDGGAKFTIELPHASILWPLIKRSEADNRAPTP